MDADKVREWVEGYRRAWESNDPGEIEILFADDARYFTEPYAEPWVGRETIVRSWIESKDEPGTTTFEFDVIATYGDLGIVKARTGYTDGDPRSYWNLWEIRLDASRRCTEFVEWWMKVPPS